MTYYGMLSKRIMTRLKGKQWNHVIEKKKTKIYLMVLLVSSVLSTLMLSMSYSWSFDYEPQGRYIITTLIPVFICASGGMNNLFNYLEAKMHEKVLLICIRHF